MLALAPARTLLHRLLAGPYVVVCSVRATNPTTHVEVFVCVACRAVEVVVAGVLFTAFLHGISILLAFIWLSLDFVLILLIFRL